VNPSGALAINPQFDDAMGFTNGLARVKSSGRFGYVDAAGKLVYSPTN
jgi:hypothetical protein